MSAACFVLIKKCLKAPLLVKNLQVHRVAGSHLEIFVKWPEHFIATIKSSKDKRVCTVLDGHSNHTKSLEAIE